MPESQELHVANFDLFRLNCFLNDTQANDFKRIIVSLVNEYLFDRNNIEIKISECYDYIVKYHKIEIEKDYLVSIISNSNSFEKIPLQNDLLIRLTSKKFSEINDKLKEHSIEVFIESFLKK